MFRLSTSTRGSPRNPSVRPWVYCLTSAMIAAGLTCLAAAMRSTWMSAFCGEMSGSRPEPEVVTASGGIWEIFTWSNLAICCCSCLMFLIRTGLFGPRFDAVEYRGSQP